MDIMGLSKRRRRGSLQLSINAIVILVMAMVVLGLGLGFIRGLFGQGQESLTKVMDNNMLENKATYNEPFTLDRNVKVKVGEATPVFMGIYNKGQSPDTFAIFSPFDNNNADIKCQRTDDNMNSDPDEISVVFPDNVGVDAGEGVGVRGSVLVPEAAGSGSYVCTVKAVGSTTYTSTMFITASGG